MPVCTRCNKLVDMSQMSAHFAEHFRRGIGVPLDGEPVEPADPVNRPTHYTHGKIQPIDVIEDWRLGFCLGNCVKYIGRADHKGTPLDDLKKARWYLDREITRREGER